VVCTGGSGGRGGGPPPRFRKLGRSPLLQSVRTNAFREQREECTLINNHTIRFVG
jgi:hypothetical protein